MSLLRAAANANFLALHSLRHEPWRALAIAAALGLTAALPLAAWLAGGALERSLLARSESTPILVGARGNDYDLALSSLYFQSRPQARISFGTVAHLRADRPDLFVPLYLAHTAQGAPIVATTQDYFAARNLTLEVGRPALQLGEVVVGAEVARRFGCGVGARLRNDLTNLYNIAGAYPFLLRVVGVLAAAGTADDGAIFTSLKTAWTLDGRMHGHQAVSAADTLAQEDGTVEASAAIFLFPELTATNRASFHLHGPEEEAPITAVLVFPDSAQSHDLLLGDLALDEELQAVRPRKIVETVLGIVLRLRRLLDLYFVQVTLAALLLAALIAVLTARLRRSETRLLRDLGAGRGQIAMTVVAEISWIAALGAAICVALAMVSLRALELLLAS